MASATLLSLYITHILIHAVQLSLVVRLLYHQGPIKLDGFDARTGHSQAAVGGILDRLKKKYVTDAAGEAPATAATKDDDPKPKAEKKGKKSTKKAKKDVEEADEEPADAPVEKKKRERKPSKKATESTEPAKSKTPAPEASTESKGGKKRSKSKNPGAEPKAKKAKTEVEA